MLLGNKKTQSNEQNWCVILSPLKNELDKKRIGQKIADIFSLSISEAGDLVSNTPIILLDNLTRVIAAKAKDYFVACGAEVILTNDTVMKRKCYRTVWPEPPNLTFLHELEKEPVIQKIPEKHPLNPQDAIEEMRDLGREDFKKTVAADFGPIPIPLVSDSHQPRGSQELEKWKRECLNLRDEISLLRAELSRQVKDKAVFDKSGKDVQSMLKIKDKEVSDLRVVVKSTQEKYDAIREEYRETRSLFEEKLTNTARDNEQLKARFEQVSEAMQKLQREQKKSEEELKNKSEQLKNLSGDLEMARQGIGEKESQFIRDNEKLRSRLLELEKNNAYLQNEKAKHEEAFLKAQEELKRNAADFTLARQQSVDKTSHVARENEELRIKLNQANEKIDDVNRSIERSNNEVLAMQKKIDEGVTFQRMLEEKLQQTRRDFEREKAHLIESMQLTDSLKKGKDNLERTLQNSVSQITEWREKYSEMSRRLEIAEKMIQDEKRLREIAESREKDFEKSQMKLLQELESRAAEVLGWETKYQDLEAKIQEMREAMVEREKAISRNLELLESRERELESSRKQIREINHQLEHRETIQKKNQIATQLIEKESEFKRLIADQEKIEKEIRDKEESMRAILQKQEAVEKEIIEAKQAQRHLQERMKKETVKPGRKFFSADSETNSNDPVDSND